ncbi:MAG: hypothetical protein P1U89_28010 [Verrucomicrobiales bacterium]|nr:hypothetical protein [Verrucomicrobiales bacterium]
MKNLILATIILFASEIGARADVLQIAMKGRPVVKLSNPGDIDYLRTHVVFVFDMAAHHCQKDSDSRWKPNQKEIKDMINRLKGEGHLELEFTVPTPITVEERNFVMKRLWVSIRDSDWATFDWAFETPEGQLVALSGIEGTFNRKLGPMIRGLVREPSEQVGADQPATPPESKPEGNEKPEPESKARPR